MSVHVFVLVTTVADGWGSANSAASGVAVPGQPSSTLFLTSTSPVAALSFLLVLSGRQGSVRAVVLRAAGCEMGCGRVQGSSQKSFSFLSLSHSLPFSWQCCPFVSVPVARGQQELVGEHGAVQLEEGGCQQGLAQGRKDVFWHLLSLRAEEAWGAPCLETTFWRLC